MKLPFGKKVKCIVCDARVIKDKAATIQYKYEMDQLGVAYVCKQCADQIDEVALGDIDE
tara:strand:- start:75 stop:251 length:177 start_codon:yes stop_codon:yes gene_type:complete